MDQTPVVSEYTQPFTLSVSTFSRNKQQSKEQSLLQKTPCCNVLTPNVPLHAVHFEGEPGHLFSLVSPLLAAFDSFNSPSRVSHSLSA